MSFVQRKPKTNLNTHLDSHASLISISCLYLILTARVLHLTQLLSSRSHAATSLNLSNFFSLLTASDLLLILTVTIFFFFFPVSPSLLQWLHQSSSMELIFLFLYFLFLINWVFFFFFSFCLGLALSASVALSIIRY